MYFFILTDKVYACIYGVRVFFLADLWKATQTSVAFINYYTFSGRISKAVNLEDDFFFIYKKKIYVDIK